MQGPFSPGGVFLPESRYRADDSRGSEDQSLLACEGESWKVVAADET